jgi:hypothetical protein
MAKKDNLGKELAEGNRPMFMTAGEIVKHINLNDSSQRYGTVFGEDKEAWLKDRDQNTLRRKLRQSRSSANSDTHGAGLHESIKTQGFKGRFNIVDYGHEGRLFEGHHRLAAQRNLNPKQFNSIIWVNGLNY